jgi:hypothetical protein
MQYGGVSDLGLRISRFIEAQVAYAPRTALLAKSHISL